MVKKIIFPLIAAIIWGTAFVAQSMGAQTVPPFSFNAARSIVAVATLAIILTISNKIKKRNGAAEKIKGGKGGIKTLLIGGFCCGTAMAVATGLQQTGLGETDAGKASFITALYIVLVPIFARFFGKRISVFTAVSIAIAVAGMYLLCVSDSLTVGSGDIYVILCAFCFSIHILVIDRFAPFTDCIALSLVQFSVMAIESAIVAAIFEKPSLEGLVGALLPILYLGIFSSGIAYTLQIVAQKGSDPTLVALILSLESVFGALAGALILHETMSSREIIGSALMLVAVILSQLPAEWLKKLPSKKAEGKKE